MVLGGGAVSSQRGQDEAEQVVVALREGDSTLHAEDHRHKSLGIRARGTMTVETSSHVELDGWSDLSTSTTLPTPPTCTGTQHTRTDDAHDLHSTIPAHTINTHQDNATPPSTLLPEPSDGCNKASRRTRKTLVQQIGGKRADGSRVASGTNVAKILEKNYHLDTTRNLEQRLETQRTRQKSGLKGSSSVQTGRKDRDKKVAIDVKDGLQQPVENSVMDACRSSGASDSTRDDPSAPHGEPRRPDDPSSMLLGEGLHCWDSLSEARRHLWAHTCS